MEGQPGRVALVVHRLGGRATWQQLLLHSTSHHVRQALHSGEIVRAATDVYVLPGLSGEALAAARARGALCLLSAAQAWRLPLLRPPTQVHVAVPRGRQPPAVAGVRYRYAPLTTAEIRQGRTSLSRTVLDCAAVLPFPEALTVADAALNQDRLTGSALVAAAEGLYGRGRARRLRVVRAADRGAESPLESALRAILLDAGITTFRTQVQVPAGRWGATVDLGDPARRVAIEAEGFEYHAATREAFNRDLKRYDELNRIGWMVLRFTWRQVVFEPGWVVAVVRDVLAERAA